MSDKLQGGIKAGSTSVSLPVILRKTSDNTELTGIAAAGVTAAYYWRQGGTPTAITALSDLAAITSAYAAGGWKEADATHTPGAYRLDVDDAAFATGADWVIIGVKVASAYVFFEKYALTTNVVQSGDTFAIAKSGGAGDLAVIKTSTGTNVAPGAAGGLWILGANAAANTTLTGTAASGATPATAALTLTGGAANTTSGGTSAPGLSSTGGAGAASTNGAAAGATWNAGGTTTVSGNDGAVFTATGNGNGVTFAHAGTGKDINASSTNLVLAKTTNITGFNDIAATAIVSGGAITTSGGAVTTVTNLTNLPAIPNNWLTAAGIAAGALNGKGDWIPVVRTGTAQGGTGSTITLDAGASATDNIYRGQWILLTGNTGAGQVANISGYVGSTKVATVSFGWITAPDNTTTFALLPTISIDNQVWDVSQSSHNIDGTMGGNLFNASRFYATSGFVNDAAPTASSFVTNLSSSVNNFYNDQTLLFITGALAGQSKPIKSYNGATFAPSFDEAFTSAPANSDKFVLFATHTHPVTQIATAIFQDTTASDFTIAGSIGKSLAPATLGTAPGAAGGFPLVGTNLPVALSANNNIKSDIEEIAGNTGGASRLDRSARAIATGSVGSGSTTTNVVVSSVSPSMVVASQFNGRILIFDKDTTTANLRGQATNITANDAAGNITVTALTTAPVSGDSFTIT